LKDDFYIRKVDESELEKSAEVIRKSFATVAKQFHFTKEKNPGHRAFMQVEELINDRKLGEMQFGLFINNSEMKVLAGFMALEKINENIYKLEKLAVLPEYRHNNYGRALVEFAKCKVKELDAVKLTLSIIEENKVLKNWYAENGFVHTGTEIFPHLPFTVGYMEMEL
jgi:GNAT superfamily N-acetyltransferase